MKPILLFASLLSLDALGHGGGLDAKGGHYNRSTAEYHCHQEPCFSNQQNQIDEIESDAPLANLEGVSDGMTCNGLLNRPQFSRHSTAAFRAALHTLPAISGY